jgi:hypothetical protein
MLFEREVIVMRFLIFSLLFAFGAANAAHDSGGVFLDKQFTVRYGQTKTVREAGVKVEFTSVIDDSRCPKGVTCVWAGNGKISVKLSKAGHSPALIELNTTLEPKKGSYLDYEITLINLQPYPESNKTLSKKSYAAVLLIRKK